MFAPVKFFNREIIISHFNAWLIQLNIRIILLKFAKKVNNHKILNFYKNNLLSQLIKCYRSRPPPIRFRDLMNPKPKVGQTNSFYCECLRLR